MSYIPRLSRAYICVSCAFLYTYLGVCTTQETWSSDVVLRASVQATLWCDRRTSCGRSYEPSIRWSTLPALPVPARLPPAPPPPPSTDSAAFLAEQWRPWTLPRQVSRWTSPVRGLRRHYFSHVDVSARRFLLKSGHVTLTVQYMLGIPVFVLEIFWGATVL